MDGNLMIRFTRMNPPYLANETALFDSTYAIKLATEGVAILLDPPVGFDQHGNRKKPEANDSFHENVSAPKPNTAVKGRAKKPPRKKPELLIGGFTIDQFDLSADRKPKHIGGGRYDIAGVRVRGKAKAKAIAKALADLPTPPPEGEGD